MIRRRRGVMHFFASFERGGAETRTLEAMTLMGPSVEDHIVVALGASGGPMREEFEGLGAATRFRRFKSVSGMWGVYQDLRTVRVAHSHLGALSAPLLILARLARVQVRVAHYHSDSTINRVKWRGKVGAALANRTVRSLATDIVGASPSALTFGYSNTWKNDARCLVMLNGVPVPELPQHMPDAYLKNYLGIPTHGKVLVHVGRDIPDKNRRRAVDIVARVGEESTRVHLVFIGRDADHEQRALADHAAVLGLAGRVHWMGQRDDVHRLLLGADLLLITSRREGMPGVLLEALAAGLPAVSSDVPGAVLVSQTLPDDVACLSLKDDTTVWADQVLKQLGRQNSLDERRDRRDRLASSRFELSRCVEPYRNLWHGKTFPERKPRVVHLFSRLDPGGAEVRTLELIEWLNAQGAKHDQLVLQSGGTGTMTEQFENAGVRVVSRRFRSWRFWWACWWILRDADTVALHLHVNRGISKSALLLPLAKWGGVSVRIVHYRSDGDFEISSRAGRLLESFCRMLIGRMATDIVGVSPASLQLGWSEDWQSDPRCRVLLSGVRMDRFEAVPANDVLRREIGALPADLVVVHAGRDVPLKNRERAIEVLAAVRDGQVDARLAFVGRDSESEHVRHQSLIQERGLSSRISFLGERDDVPQLLAGADVLLVTSTREGMPGVLLEALAAGTVAVVADLPGTRDVAERMPGITVCSLSGTDSVWADAVIKSQDSPPSRAELVAALITSEFDTRQASEAFVNLWSGRR